MKAETELRELTRDELLLGLDRGKRKAVQGLFDDADVHYVVLMESADGARRNLLTVGPHLEYVNLESIEGLQLDGLLPVAYVHAAVNRGRRSTKLFRTRSADQIEQLEADLGAMRLENKRLVAQLDQMEADQALTAQERILLQSRADRLVQQEQAHKDLQNQLNHREVELLKMEEDLMDRMHTMVEKEAELQQWEENMFARERKLAERLKQAGLEALDVQASR